MSIAKKEIETITDHTAGKERQEEISKFQREYGHINRRVQEELELTDEEAYHIISLHCLEEHCKHHGNPHWYALPSSGCLLCKCNKYMIYIKTWPIKLLREKEDEN